jgi:hypothetical protein
VVNDTHGDGTQRAHLDGIDIGLGVWALVANAIDDDSRTFFDELNTATI